MLEENTHSRLIQDIRYRGESPYVQYDILDARTLLQMFQVAAPHLYLNSRRLGRILLNLEMRPIGLAHIKGRQCKLWTCLPPQPLAGIAAIIRERVRTGATDLRTHLIASPDIPPPPEILPLLTTFERQVLSLRIQPQGLRYPRPREIAAQLDCSRWQVNPALQSILRKLRVPSFKRMAEVREAIRRTGCLMEDPAFS